MHGLASSAFARHYSRNHFCFLFLRVLRCFTSPRSPPTPIYSVPGDTTSLVPGFPIRTSSDPRSVDNSPRHIAASHVLHRLPVPRHPPCALKHLQHKTNCFEKNCTSRKQTNPPQTYIHGEPTLAARCSQPLSTNQTPHPTTKTRGDNNHTSSSEADPKHCGSQTTPGFPHSGQRGDGPVVSKPNSVSGNSITALRLLETRCGSTFVVHQNHTHYRRGPSIESAGTRLIRTMR